MTHEEMRECFRLMRTHLETLEVELHTLARMVDEQIQPPEEARPIPEQPTDSIGE